ncbi:MAG TPA: hypothetical protein VIY27_06720 [Myxococcota bacterium]
MKARIAEINIRGRENVTVKRRATVEGTKEDILKKMRALAKKASYRSVFGAIDDKTGRLIAARDVVERGGKKTSVRISPKTRAPARRAVAALAREAYGIKAKKPRRRTSRNPSAPNRRRRRRTSRNATRRRTSRR